MSQLSRERAFRRRRIGVVFDGQNSLMCGRRGAFLEKSPKIMGMGLKPAQNGEPEDPFPWQGCGKFERRDWQRASCQQTEIAHASGFCDVGRGRCHTLSDTALCGLANLSG
jgi:hypothetical protein